MRVTLVNNNNDNYKIKTKEKALKTFGPVFPGKILGCHFIWQIPEPHVN